MSEMLTVTCPSCGRYLYTIDADNLAIGEVVRASDFIPCAIDVARPENFDPLQCPLCDADLTPEIDGLLYKKHQLESYE